MRAWIGVPLAAFALLSFNLPQADAQTWERQPFKHQGKGSHWKATPRESDGGILTGEGYAFSLSAPRGWLFDTQAGRSDGVLAVFYRRGESWAMGDAVMYTTVVYKDKKGMGDTIDKVIKADMDRFLQNNPGMKAQRGRKITTGDGRKATVYTFTQSATALEGKAAAQEKIAYIDTPRAVVLIVLSSHTKESYDRSLADFSTLVHSFAFVGDKIDASLGGNRTLPRL